MERRDIRAACSRRSLTSSALLGASLILCFYCRRFFLVSTAGLCRFLIPYFLLDGIQVLIYIARFLCTYMLTFVSTCIFYCQSLMSKSDSTMLPRVRSASPHGIKGLWEATSHGHVHHIVARDYGWHGACALCLHAPSVWGEPFRLHVGPPFAGTCCVFPRPTIKNLWMIATQHQRL